jgi:hypothetical protein
MLESDHMYDIVDKHWPMSEGDGKATRKKRPRILAITTDCCTGCSGSPACIEYCPIEACMFWVPDEDHPPFGRIEVLISASAARSVRAKVRTARFSMAVPGTRLRWCRRTTGKQCTASRFPMHLPHPQPNPRIYPRNLCSIAFALRSACSLTRFEASFDSA